MTHRVLRRDCAVAAPLRGRSIPGLRMSANMSITLTDAHSARLIQTAMTSMSGSTVRNNPSIPARVPEIELGQLPQAPW